MKVVDASGVSRKTNSKLRLFANFDFFAEIRRHCECVGGRGLSDVKIKIKKLKPSYLG